MADRDAQPRRRRHRIQDTPLMPTIEPIKIAGLREFQAALKQMDGETQKQLKAVLDDAARTVVGGAAASIRARSSQREARVMGGSAKVRYYGFIDFGGAVGRNKSVKRHFISEGRYMYPAFHANRDSIYTALQKSIVQLAEDAGLGVNSGG
jgi:hypothetical protein